VIEPENPAVVARL
jgi:hypothetical protein